MTPQLKTFIENVAYMRAAQITYFEKIAKAKKSKLPRDFAEAATTLKIAKDYEASVDAQLKTLR